MDRVRHKYLITKLRELGVHSGVLHWIESYLADRTQYVKIAGHSSRQFSVTSGIPQGSHLGPLLFLLFFDDISTVIKSSECSMYADDLKIYKRIRTVLDCTALQRDLEAVAMWCERNCLYLNIGKCKHMSFYRNRTPITFGYAIDEQQLERIYEVRDLGVLFDVQLTFKRHAEYVVAKAYSMLGFIKRVCKEFNDVRALKSVYCAHVRSHLEYASVVWQPHCANQIRSIESVQKKFVLYALRRTVRRDEHFRLPPYASRCEVIGIDDLAKRRKDLSAFFVFDVLRERINAPILRSNFIVNQPRRNLRRHELLFVNFHRTEYGFYDPIDNLCRIFNEQQFSGLYDDVITRGVFRKRVKSAR